ncbi:MAG: transcriptional regulator [Rhodobacteraceae bacterium]|nr:transcriptional regulator [Paracoccaceae bacterium]|tara:strand:- start:24 stop:326 length:303 start_codon:yes stop_codon:yes gene_type:complete
MKPGTGPAWDQHSIKAELHRRGMTLTALAEGVGMKQNAFSHVWKRTNRKAEKAIADFLGMPVEQLFPDRYPVTKTRIFNSKKYGRTEGQKASSANDRVAA